MDEALGRLKTHYDTTAALEMDPLLIPRGYTDIWDREVAGFVAAHLAYGRVAPMLRAIRGALAPLGAQPAAFLRGGAESELAEVLGVALRDWKWRFQVPGDLVAWLLAWKRLDLESGFLGLEAHLLPRPGEDADHALSRLVQRLRVELPGTHGLRFCLPDPLEGAACKRWRLFLRWMVRPGWPDLGQWAAYPPSELVIPLDTHVARIGRLLGLTRRTATDGRTAREITEALRRLDPEDPLAYDFALSHLGILGDCPVRRAGRNCGECPLGSVCLRDLGGGSR